MTATRDKELEAGALEVVVIDAGVGNLGNLERALAALGAVPKRTTEAARVARADCLFLPGVGAFRPPREALRGALEEAIKGAVRRGVPLFGICVGFQLLFESSSEFGETDGLGLVPGHIERLPSSVALPHIGWNRLRLLPREGTENTTSDFPDLLADTPEGAHAYFVHSYAPVDVPASVALATALHGRRFPAVVAHGSVVGTQFHPEKSGRVGLRLLCNFLRAVSERREAAA